RGFADPDPSLAIHSRTYAGQFSSVTPRDSHCARNVTASRSTSVTSFRSIAIERGRFSCPTRSPSPTRCSGSMRPLTVSRTTPPSVVLSIFNPELFRSLEPEPETSHRAARLPRRRTSFGGCKPRAIAKVVKPLGFTRINAHESSGIREVSRGEFSVGRAAQAPPSQERLNRALLILSTL